MKKSFLSSMFAGLAVMAMTITSCTTDPCKDVSCGTWGECVEGDCVCDAGYEGTTCDTEERAKFIGSANMSGSVTCPVSGNGSFPATAFTMSNATSVMNFNINGAGLSLVATMSSSTSFTIDSQAIGTYTYTGSGSINGTNLTLTLNEQDPSVPETCVYALTGTLN